MKKALMIQKSDYECYLGYALDAATIRKWFSELGTCRIGPKASTSGYYVLKHPNKTRNNLRLLPYNEVDRHHESDFVSIEKVLLFKSWFVGWF